jgi:hypothetical protein
MNDAHSAAGNTERNGRMSVNKFGMTYKEAVVVYVKGVQIWVEETRKLQRLTSEPKRRPVTHNIQTSQVCIVSSLVYQGECQTTLPRCLI